jgi:hypothetical protein
MTIPPTWTLPDPIRLRLGQNTFGRQRTIFEDGHLLLVLHLPPGPDDSKREGVLFWRNPAGEWQASRGGSGAGVLNRHVQAYAERENKLTRDYERATETPALFDILEALAPLARAARNMHQALQSARETVKADPAILEARDLASDTERNLELLLEDTRNALQFRTARKAEEQAKTAREALRASHRLNVLAALFLPLTALASIFGMNLKHGLDESHPVTFWLVFGAGILVGILLRNWVVAKEPTEKP